MTRTRIRIRIIKIRTKISRKTRIKRMISKMIRIKISNNSNSSLFQRKMHSVC